jgi:hypothetical protein
MKQSQSWFTDLWNNSVIPYLVQVIKDSSARVCIFVFELTNENPPLFSGHLKNFPELFLVPFAGMVEWS